MFRFLKISASSTVGRRAQPIRPPVQEKLFDAPLTNTVFFSIPGWEMML
jgi:hypothetical protein